MDNVVLLGDLPPRLQLELDGASDSGLPNDSLTNLTSVRLVGTTDPIQAVLLDINGDGFNDGNTTADAFGDFHFDDVPLAEGANQIRVQATNQQGANVVTRTITLDTQRPTGQLVDPEPDTAILQDPGFVVVQWTDSGAAGLDPATLGVGDIAISGVTVDRIEDLGNGLVRYHYNDDGDALPGRNVDVVLVPGEVADRAGNVNLEKTQSFVLVTLPPLPSLAGPTTGLEGSLVELVGSAVDRSGANSPIRLDWTVAKNGSAFAAGTGGEIRFTPNDDGIYEVTLTATDDEGASDTITHTVDVANVAPTPSITGPATGSFAEPVSLTGSATDPAGANDVVSLAWSVTREGVFFSDGTGGAIQFTPDAAGLYRVTLAASDEDGGSNNAEHLVNVMSIKPAPSIAGPATGLEGQLLSFAGTSASTGESVTFSWTVAKGSAPFATGTGSDIQFTPDDNGSFVITLTATNSVGSTNISRSVSVANVAPTPLITGPATGREGEVIAWAGSATDPAGANDTVNLLWSVTQGGLQVASGSGTSFQFRPGDDGQYVLTLIASDEDGGSASTELIVSVDNVAPTASLSGPTSGIEGSPLTLLGSATDPAGSHDILTFTWLVAKDGLAFASGSGRNIRFTPDNNGLYQVTLTVSDEDGGVDAVGQEVTVANVAPVIADLTNNAAQAGGVTLHEPVSITATFTDVGLFDTHTARLDWGDGSLQEPATIRESHGSGTIAASHAYRESGLYTISLVLSDQDGGEDTAQTQAFLPGAGRHGRELQIIGSQGNDIVTVTPSGTTRMFVNVTLQGSGNVRQFYNLVDVDLIRIYVDGGNDRVMVSDRLAIPSVIFGGSGDDHLQGGDGYNLIVGGAGDDAILGGDERDVLIGGTGADQLFGYGGEDVLLGGPANNSSAELETILDVWISDALFDDRVASILDLLNLAADASQDDLYGGGDVDLVFPSLPDSLINDTTSISYSVPEAVQAGWLEPVVGVPGVYRTVVDPETESGAVKGDFLWTNPQNPLDVNDDQRISPLDALIVINDLNQHGTRLLDDFFAASLADRFYLDTSSDGRVSPLDVLLIINALNRGEQLLEPGPSALAEGESAAAREVEFVPYVPPQTSRHRRLPTSRCRHGAADVWSTPSIRRIRSVGAGHGQWTTGAREVVAPRLLKSSVGMAPRTWSSCFPRLRKTFSDAGSTMTAELSEYRGPRPQTLP